MQVGRAVEVDAVGVAEAAQVLAQPRPLARPAADAVVRVAVLREDPAVAAGDDAELDRRTPSLPGRQRPVAFERDPVDDAAAEPRGARERAVHAVGADDRRAPRRACRRP